MKLTGRNYQIAPAGQHNAVCVDFVDLGMEQVEWKGTVKHQHKCRIVWELEATTEDGRRFVVGRKFTASLDEKSALRPFLEAWRGKAFTAAELKGFDSENLVGVGALIQIVHKTVGDRTYDNVNAIMLPPKGLKWLEAAEADGKPVYVRVKDRPAPEPAMVAVAAGDPGPLYPDDDDDLPF